MCESWWETAPFCLMLIIHAARRFGWQGFAGGADQNDG